MDESNVETVDPLVAHASVVVAASRASVWDALLRPETITRIMPVTEVVAAWRVGCPFLWRIDLQGEVREVAGTVWRLEAERLLEYEYLDPLPENVHQIENRHQVTIALSDEETGTRVSVAQDNNVTRVALAHAEGGWRMALNNFKAIVERERGGSDCR